MTRIPIPLYIEARNPEGVQVRLIADPAHRVAEGPWLCRVKAPSGREAHGTLATLDPDAAATLFGDIDRLELQVDLDGLHAQGPDLFLETQLCFWSGETPLGDGTVEQVSVGGERLRGLAMEAPQADRLQVWTEDGASLVTAWPGRGVLVPVPGYPGAERRVQPLVIGANPRCSAYWGFYRHGEWRAASIIGREMLARVNNLKSSPTHDELIVAGHFALNITPPEPSKIRVLVERLAADPSRGDGLLLYWAFAFDGLIPREAERPENALLAALSALQWGRSTRTEVFRQVMQRLGDAEAALDREGAGLPPDLVAGIRELIPWVQRLASATYWDSEYLTYRAGDPSEPLPDATSRDIAAGAKKKSE
ncbi:hypothetical protein OVY29_20965 [Sphingopyxis sp. SE2]|uniref:hypothetical protein n=1 Tax=Sphingopyxis sp. SE2 TaxID=1586240 RepID=UPI0028BF9706|nr:hypothetical protein [Sphingopyxis sp. SE2]MDT7531140.1 hypothetical protein [Sphingopyxis sp. SE2]